MQSRAVCSAQPTHCTVSLKVLLHAQCVISNRLASWVQPRASHDWHACMSVSQLVEFQKQHWVCSHSKSAQVFGTGAVNVDTSVNEGCSCAPHTGEPAWQDATAKPKRTSCRDLLRYCCTALLQFIRLEVLCKFGIWNNSNLVEYVHSQTSEKFVSPPARLSLNDMIALTPMKMPTGTKHCTAGAVAGRGEASGSNWANVIVVLASCLRSLMIRFRFMPLHCAESPMLH